MDVRCPSCKQEVAAVDFCIRCGYPLSEDPALRGHSARRRHFAAAPEEPARAVRLTSTVFPQLRRADMEAFRLALALGVVTVVALGMAGLFSIALVAAAVLMPLLMLLYLINVDVYEDQPLYGLGFSVVWGAISGILAGLLLRATRLGDDSAVYGLHDVVVQGVAIPLLGALLMLGGPLVLLRYRKFNDVLDGASFGSASAVTFASALTLVRSLPLLTGGVQPDGDVLEWVVRLLEIAVLFPVLAAGALGGAAGALWLRYRAPVSSRNALGIFSAPIVAVMVAFALLVGAALGQLLLNDVPSVAWLAVLVAAALTWLRRVIHLGLLQELVEAEVGPVVVCANCFRLTPHHSFCGRCGISLRALPKGAPDPPDPVPAATGPAPPVGTNHPA